MAVSFNKAPLGITLSHVTPTGATHSNAFHTIASCYVNNKRINNNVTVKVEIFNSLSDYNAGKPQIDDLNFTFTLAKNVVSGKGVVTRRNDILVQAYNNLMTLTNPDGSSTDYDGVANDNGATADNDTRKGDNA
jgi:hypothetical protein